MNDVLILGLNPAWQRLFELADLVPGEVHRLGPVHEYASGKGVNCARVLRTLGVQATLAHFLGGTTGRQLFQELQSQELEQLSVTVQQTTRVCTTLAVPKNSESAGHSTELIEVSPLVEADECAQMGAALQGTWQRWTRVAVCGSFPRGVSDSLLAQFPIKDKRVFIDALCGVDTWLHRGVELLKVNGAELLTLGARLGVDLSGFNKHPAAVAALLRTRWPVQNLVVTLGHDGSVLVNSIDKVYFSPICANVELYNTIGAGDAFLAGWIQADVNGLDEVACFGAGSAAAQARCEVALPWQFTTLRFNELLKWQLMNLEVLV